MKKQKNKLSPTARKYFKKYIFQNKWKILAYFLSYIVFYGLTIFSSVLISDFLASMTDNVMNVALSQLIQLIILTIFIYLSHYILYMIWVVIQNKVMLSVQKDLVDTIFNITSSSMSKASSGSIVSRIATDPDTLILKFESLIDLFASALSYFATLTILIVINVWIGLISAGFLILIATFELIRAKANNRNMKKSKLADDRNITFTNELVRSEKDIKAQGIDSGLKDIALERFSEKCKITRQRHYLSISLWFARSLLTVVYIATLVFVGIHLLENHAIVLANFIFIFTNREALQNVVWQYSKIIFEIGEIKILANRVFELHDTNIFEQEKFGTKTIVNPKGEIKFENVTFGYTKSKTILNNMSFQIPAHQTVAFVGKSGCGKSTILSLISKILKIDNSENGKIFIDNIDIQDLTKDSLKSNINYLNQFPYIFNLTIKENMKLINPELTDEQIIDALKKVDLWDYVSQLELGLDTLLGENGVNISGGQKQRLTIARAFLKDSNIMLFDESTSSLDNLAQETIMQHIDQMKGTKTIVLVAHRLSTIKNVDKIYFIDNGKIVDEGNFIELIEKNKKFKKLFLLEK